MKRKAFTVSLSKNPDIVMNVIPGHFTTSHFHLTHYLDLDNLKTNSARAREVATELALPYVSTTLVDTIVCLEGTEVIGAYMAEELSRQGTSVINAGRDIYIVTPLNNINRQLIFQSNTQELIDEKNVILLVSSVSSGITIKSALECLSYYNGKVVGISALFNAFPDESEHRINSLFTSEDFPDYKMLTPSDCEMCKNGRKLDAIIMQGGYTRI
ncbi:MAG: phosphoribosyltransferase [Clostridiaceae bacterium]|jgi:orotate phosphoribosyltransferase|nr:phosphoribosyltransferase [Clostridiaceae bacterium]